MSKALVWSVATLCVLGISAGQLLFKHAAERMNGDPSATLWRQWILNAPLVMALLIYGFATMGWVWVLKTLPLNLAYPLMALAFVIVPLMSSMVFKESLDLRYFLGSALIIFGIMTLTLWRE